MSEITREVLVKGLSKGKHSLAEETTALEEKKESSDLPVDAVHASEKSGEGDLESGLSPTLSLQKRRNRFQELPEGLAELFGGQVFRDEDELEKHLRELKIADEAIVLCEDGKACYHMPGEEHNTGTGYIARKFNSWARDMKGFAQENTNIKLRPRLPGAPPPLKRQRPKKRLPDVALWGRTKCYFDNDGRIRGAMRATPASAQPKVHPHVVIQLSVFDDEDYEVDAINDLATRAIPGQGTPPNLGILIKSREANGPGIQAGFDIYYLPAGTFFDDAVNGTNDASHVVYNYGGPDVVVTITEANLGGVDLSVWESIMNFLTGRGNDFELSMADLYEVTFVS
ncbi:expressed unknown protein [Seminavis robusta]|uniref:Uncharacterized protein n=1 Tax=Seminavis robusta TaxID=568900 RepID=A0A9N8F479_9STRA|nr:expressed unknown protein [Seminavis robusta]|eukprot:Sro3309_g346520.1 n/a (341) ;mRNA; f:1928-2950